MLLHLALLNISPGVSPFNKNLPQTPPSSAPIVPGPLPQSKWQHSLPDQVEPPSPLETTSKVTAEELPIQNGRRKCSSIKHCEGVTRKPSAGIPNWCERQERITTRKTAQALTAKLPTTRQMFSRT